MLAGFLPESDILKEIKRLKEGIKGWQKGSYPHTEGIIKLQGIKQTVEAVDKTGFEDFMIKTDDLDNWQEIKQHLKSR